MLPLSTIIHTCKATLSGRVNDGLIIDTLITDSRQITSPQHALFIAIRTPRNDGHRYVKDAYDRDVRVFLVSHTADLPELPEATVLCVPDTVLALQQIGAAVRQQYAVPVLGITGSNGKTIIKEWLYQLLGNVFEIIRSPRSYNSQIGVPLSVWGMNSRHTLAIFEAGISEPGEMDLLEKVIRPTVGIFTNIGEAHNQGFLNSRQKINEKLQLFRNAASLIYCRDYHELNECIAVFAQNIKAHTDRTLALFSWSFKHEATLQITSVEKHHGRSRITARYKDTLLEITIPFTDTASIENAINCWCFMLLMNVDSDIIEKGMAQLKPIAMRLELRQGDQQNIIINDSYNSDLTSLNIALDMLVQQKQQAGRTVILSDMQQTGRAERALYSEVAGLILEKNINRFVGIGPAMMQYRSLFEAIKPMDSFFFPDTEHFLQHIQEFTFANEAILLKGARSFAFEKISLLLEQKIHQTVMTVNLTAMCANLEAFRRRLKDGVRTMAMVKASSYGSGGYEIANVLQDKQVDYLTVAYVDEGVALRKSGISLPIMVMSPSTEAFERMIVWKLEPELFNMRSVKQFVAAAESMGAHNYPVHIKLDTGMHRLGFMADEIPLLIETLKQTSTLYIASIFSHLAASDDALHEDFTHAQAALFEQMSNQVVASLSYRPLRHLCNTAGIVRYPQYHFDMVRLGLGLYGIDASRGLEQQLQPISTLRTTIAQIKDIPEGETIGYSRRGKATRPLRIATICIGYADGYPRTLSKSDAYVLIHNKPARLIGAIAMDMCMVDITDIEGVQEGDEVIVFGDTLPIQQVAEWAGTIAYEIMTGISQRVKRVYVNET